jgi:uncharacterized damage-inducible protein DinB
MSTRTFFAERLGYDLPAFLKVIRALPAERLDYKPHEKNTAAGQLAWQMALEIEGVPALLRTGVLDMGPRPVPQSVEEIAALFEKAANEAIEAAKSASDERWNGPGKFLYGGHLAWEDTVANIAWGFLFDLVHHRGQLTAYLRPMGGIVPAVYGPSADER